MNQDTEEIDLWRKMKPTRYVSLVVTKRVVYNVTDLKPERWKGESFNIVLGGNDEKRWNSEKREVCSKRLRNNAGGEVRLITPILQQKIHCLMDSPVGEIETNAFMLRCGHSLLTAGLCSKFTKPAVKVSLLHRPGRTKWKSRGCPQECVLPVSVFFPCGAS